jgi:hypothetical protein
MTTTHISNIAHWRYIPAVGGRVGFDAEGRPWFTCREHAERYRAWKDDQDKLAAECDYYSDTPTRAEVKPNMNFGVDDIRGRVQNGAPR